MTAVPATIAERSGERVPARTIAFLHHGADWIRGSEQCLLDLVARLNPQRFRSLVVCDQPSLARAAAALGAAVEQLPAGDEWGVHDRAARARTRARLRRTLTAHGAALAHVNVTAIIPSALPVARSLGLPLVAHLHLPITDEYLRLHWLLHQADVVVGVARHVLEPLRADGVPPERLRVILNAVDSERLGHGAVPGFRTVLGIPDCALAAVSVGSLIPRKGHDITLRAVAAARARGVDVRLVICGDGSRPSDLTGLVALSESLGITEFVHFLGYRSDVGAVVRAVADVFVTSAREEVLPLNVLEAQYLGVPVVASDIPAHREAMDNDSTGILVSPESPTALAAALAELAGSPERRAALGAAGPALVTKRFAMSRYVREFETLYTEMLSRPRATYGWVGGAKWPPAYTAWVTRIARRVLRVARPGPRTGGAAAAT